MDIRAKALLVIFTTMGVLLYVMKLRDTHRIDAERAQIICPSFLSITRSARDTLIVMRNEPLCTRYVLDNLQ